LVGAIRKDIIRRADVKRKVSGYCVGSFQRFRGRLAPSPTPQPPSSPLVGEEGGGGSSLSARRAREG